MYQTTLGRSAAYAGGTSCRDESLPPLPLREKRTIERLLEPRKILGKLFDSRLMRWLCRQRSDRRTANLDYAQPANTLSDRVSASY